MEAGSLSECEFQPDIFVDLTNGQDKDAPPAKDKVAKHHAVMYAIFSHYKLKKVDIIHIPWLPGSLEDGEIFLKAI